MFVNLYSVCNDGNSGNDKLDDGNDVDDNEFDDNDNDYVDESDENNGDGNGDY